MRSAPASTAASKTFFEPSTLIPQLASPALRIANARWTTTSAPLTASRTLAGSWTSPCRYSVFFQPRPAGSNGRRAMPTIRFTRRERSSASTRAMPRSPVGPVIATFRPGCLATRRVISRGQPGGSALALRLAEAHLLAVLQLVDLVDARGVGAGAALDDVASPVDGVDRVVARARGDAVLAAAGLHVVGPRGERDAVVARAGLDGRDAAADGRDAVVARAADERV